MVVSGRNTSFKTFRALVAMVGEGLALGFATTRGRTRLSLTGVGVVVGATFCGHVSVVACEDDGVGCVSLSIDVVDVVVVAVLVSFWVDVVALTFGCQ